MRGAVSSLRYQATARRADGTMWEIIKTGGPVMWPIVLCSIGALAIVLERLWSLQSLRVTPRELTEKVWKRVEAGQLTDRHVQALAQNSPLGQILAAGLANGHRSREIILAGERVAEEYVPQIKALLPFFTQLGKVPQPPSSPLR